MPDTATPPTWAGDFDARIAALREAAAADDWARAMDIAQTLQQLLARTLRGPGVPDLAAARRAQAVLSDLVGQVATAREATASALRELRAGQRAVRAYR
ncbi:MAG: hypothetical protein KDK06_19025 [Gammaproteobacteria bacterium]|nr:hypothetical protein [Gammaproteobacteria bacterium]